MVGMVGMAEVEERDLSMSIFSLQLWINFWVRFENRGEDATAEEKATDGGPGGNGGDGGNAGKGGDGGSGGSIRFSVPKADTYLLMLYGTAKYSGGRGGRPGKPGIGGQSFQFYLNTFSVWNQLLYQVLEEREGQVARGI